MIEAHLAKLRFRHDISSDEEAAIRAAVSELRDVPADQTIIRPNVHLTHSTLLLEGTMCRYRDLHAGTRQITELHIAGDFVDLHSFTLKRLDHSIMALTPCRVALVPHDNLRRITEDYSHLTRVYWFATNLDAAIHREWQVSLGRRTALSRIAHLFCEMFVRSDIVGLISNGSCKLQLSQTDLSECLGLTAVHVNRTLQELRSRQLITFNRGVLTILDHHGLEKVAEFDPGYLYLDRQVL